VSLAVLGALETSKGRYQEARSHLEQSLRITEKLRGREHPEVGGVLNLLAVLEVKTGHPAAARADHERSLAISRPRLDAGHPQSVFSSRSSVSESGHFESTEQSSSVPPVTRSPLQSGPDVTGPDLPRCVWPRCSPGAGRRQSCVAAPALGVTDSGAPIHLVASGREWREKFLAGVEANPRVFPGRSWSYGGMRFQR
jgi:hypothetical protein